MAKGLPAHNEDAIVKTNNFLAVLDGSTSKTKYRVQPDITNGQLAAILIRDYLQSVCSSAPHLSCKELCGGLTEHFQQEYLVRNVDIDALIIHPELRPTASVVVFSRCRQEVWLIGDCQCMINGQLFENPKPHEATIARKRARLIIGGMSPDEARRCIEHDLITAMHEGQNKNYAVIDGFPIYYAGVAIIKLREWATTFPFQIVLASDGYPFLKSTLEASEQAIQKQAASDPQNIKHFLATKGIKPGYHGFDDRTYLRFIFGEE